MQSIQGAESPAHVLCAGGRSLVVQAEVNINILPSVVHGDLVRPIEFVHMCGAAVRLYVVEKHTSVFADDPSLIVAVDPVSTECAGVYVHSVHPRVFRLGKLLKAAAHFLGGPTVRVNVVELQCPGLGCCHFYLCAFVDLIVTKGASVWVDHFGPPGFRWNSKTSNLLVMP